MKQQVAEFHYWKVTSRVKDSDHLLPADDLISSTLSQKPGVRGDMWPELLDILISCLHSDVLTVNEINSWLTESYNMAQMYR